MLRGIINYFLLISSVGGVIWLAYASFGALGLFLLAAIALMVFFNTSY